MLNKTALSPAEKPKSLDSQHSQMSLIVAGVILGLGQAGFFDGIIFHQLLQWHHMFSNVSSDMTIAGLKLNTLGDGLFHLLDWILTLTGIFLLWRAVKKDIPLKTSMFVGALLLGVGCFNVIEGFIDHYWLQIHHVKPGAHQTLYDIVFLLAGAGIAALGAWLLRSTVGTVNYSRREE